MNIYLFDGKPVSYVDLLEKINNLQAKGKTYFAVGIGNGAENTALDEKQYNVFFTNLAKAKVVYQKRKIVSSYQAGRYVVLEIYSPENDYRAEILEISYS